jgi:hypothetical protein
MKKAGTAAATAAGPGVPLPPENGVRSVWRPIPVRMSDTSFRTLTPTWAATRPIRASTVRDQLNSPPYAAAAAPAATRVTGRSRNGARATPR